MERKGKKESSVILGKGQGFLYFIWLIVFRAFFLFVQFHCALSVYSADVQFSVPSSSTVCLRSSCEIVFKILCLLSYKWWSIRLHMPNGFNPRVAHGYPVIIV